MRRRRDIRFRPVGLDALEDRTVPSSGSTASMSAATVAQAQATAQQATVVDQVLTQLDQAFAGFADQYRQARTVYFADLHTPAPPSPPLKHGGATAGALSNYQNTTAQLVAALSQQVQTIVNAPGGGGGMLLPFLAARIGGDQQGGLANDLTTIPAVGTSGLTDGDFALISEQAITNALDATTSAVRIYDAALSQVANAFFNGQLVFGRLSGTAGGAQQQAMVDQVLGQVDQALTTFISGYVPVRNSFLGLSGGGTTGATTVAAGDVNAYNAAVAQLTGTLGQQVVAIVGAVPGGASLLTPYLQARLASNQTGGLDQQLTAAAGNLSGASANVSPAGFSLQTDDAIGQAVEATINAIRLYDGALVQGTFDLFVAAQSRSFQRAETTAAHFRRFPRNGDPTVTAAQLGSFINTPGFAGAGTITGTGLGGFINVPGFTGFGTINGVPLTFNGFSFTPGFGFNAMTTNPFFGFGGMGPFVTTSPLPSLTAPGVGLGFGNGFGAFNVPFNNAGLGFGGFFF